MKMFTVKDKKSEGFSMPFFQKTFGLAERSFKDAAQDTNSQIAKHPEDFALYYIGEFDEVTGLTEGLEEPKKVCDAV